LHDGEVEMKDASLDSLAASFVVSGTASIGRNLDFKLVQEGSSAFNVTGTLSDPQVSSAHHVDTQAALKPLETLLLKVFHAP
jgi:hypothetical protein